jgi:hypothetical protein
MKQTYIILALLMCCSCAAKRTASTSHTSTTEHHQRQEHRADSLSTVIQSETKVLNISAVEVETETIIYDTEHPDSTGTFPIKERRRTKATLQSNTTVIDTTTTTTNASSITDITEDADSTGITDNTIEQERQGFPPPHELILFLALIAIGTYALYRVSG